MISCIRTNSENPGFIKLVAELDRFLALIDGDEHAFYAQFNKINILKQAVVAYENGEPVGCGAFKEFATDTVEVKRMYVLPQKRGQGIASIVLAELETWAREMNYTRAVLETGHRQPEAIALYTKSGYTRTPNFGQYAGVENSVCFEKRLNSL